MTILILNLFLFFCFLYTLILLLYHQNHILNFLHKIDYCVIYSIKSDNLIFKSLYKEENDNIDIDIDIDIIVDKFEREDNNKTDKGNINKIISFYFLFNYLDDDDKSYNMINNNVVCW